MIYLDNASNTFVNSFAAAAAITEMKSVGNPSSLHSLGNTVKRRLDSAEEDILKYIGCKAGGICFTSGGTEANNIAIQLLSEYGKLNNKNHFITTTLEHSSVLKTFKHLETLGFRVTYVCPNTNGIVCVNDIERAINENTIAVSMMYVNNEIGTIQPVRKVGEICKNHNIYFHCDAVQAIGHIPVNMDLDNITLLSASAHKFGGITGVGFLAKSIDFKPIRFKPIMFGGNQNMGLRPGTENTVGIMAMRAALEVATDRSEMTSNNEIITENRDYFVSLLKNIPDIKFNGSMKSEERVSNNINISFKGVNAESLVYLLSKENIYVSTMSACGSKENERSHVLKSINLDDEYITGTIRITLSEYITKSNILTAFEVIKKYVEVLRCIENN